MYRTLCTLFLLAVACMGPLALAADGSTTHRLIIRLKNSDTRSAQALRPSRHIAAMSRLAGHPLSFVQRLDDHTLVLRLPQEMPLDEVRRIAERMRADPAVAASEPDRRVYPALVPNDRFYPDQWYLFDATSGISADFAWERSTGNSAIVIAALDSGIIAHSDLDTAGRVLPGYDFISDPQTANDGDGRDADPTDPGDEVAADECGPGTPAEPSSWHGLSVAGVMIATADNNQDMAGIDFAARLLPVRVLGKCGGFISDIIAAMRWAAGLPVPGVPVNPNPAHIINLSLGGDGGCTAQEQRAIDEVVASGAVVVVAAGNGAGDVALQTPANCDKVITVTAVGKSADLASYANRGAAVDLSAPGGDGTQGILTLFNTGSPGPAADSLAFVQGTSFATAQVSAVAALMLAVNDSLNAPAIEQILKSTTRAFPAGSTCTPSNCGTGLLDAEAALAAASAWVGGGGGGGGGGCALGAARRPDLLWLLFFFVPLARRLCRVLVTDRC